ncbi:MAG TPA: GntR family transcriptional regulator, partial [Synergistales bacterium]|nr:GntR family transcriptional regulator [Synergistales bacterium]
MRVLDKESPVPLYYQLKEILQAMVDDGELAPGDIVPSERDICERFSISRMTASKAVSA